MIWFHGWRVVARRWACIRIGNGEETDIWSDPWITGNPEFTAQLAANIHNSNIQTVNQHILTNPKRWNIDLLNTLFNEQIVEIICLIDLKETNDQDDFFRLPNRKGTHTTESFYNLDENSRADHKHKIFLGKNFGS